MRVTSHIGARLEIRFAHQHRQDRRLRAGFGIIGAAEPFAEAAIGALAERDAERVGIGLRQIAGGLRKRLVAELLGGFAEQRVAVTLLHAAASDRAASAAPSNGLPPSWIWPLRLPALPDVPHRYSNCVVMRLEIVEGDAPILDGHVGGQEIRAIALRQMALQR